MERVIAKVFDATLLLLMLLPPTLIGAALGVKLSADLGLSTNATAAVTAGATALLCPLAALAWNGLRTGRKAAVRQAVHAGSANRL